MKVNAFDSNFEVEEVIPYFIVHYTFFDENISDPRPQIGSDQVHRAETSHNARTGFRIVPKQVGRAAGVAEWLHATLREWHSLEAAVMHWTIAIG
ncbi:hypothetical protein Tcan_08296 [Toxocara canis]|uniref:Uncharacterized protein n=1 Tax=Toxocara canis TaxID=6265 RepID=A0A0B2UYZ0_TOXCA|nr:hypothetical protein Tcan_08296 [Toxocara canis]